jgi:hypothetical protein
MDDLFKIDMSFPVPEFSYLTFINLIPLIAAGYSISDKKISKRGYNLMLKSNFP